MMHNFFHQVVRIHSVDRQKRVIAKDIRGRSLSIPEDYPIKFEIIDNRKKKRKWYLLQVQCVKIQKEEFKSGYFQKFMYFIQIILKY